MLKQIFHSICFLRMNILDPSITFRSYISSVETNRNQSKLQTEGIPQHSSQLHTLSPWPHCTVNSLCKLLHVHSKQYYMAHHALLYLSKEAKKTLPLNTFPWLTWTYCYLDYQVRWVAEFLECKSKLLFQISGDKRGIVIKLTSDTF